MKYCEFNGCSSKISKGAYCEEHKRSKQSARKKQQKKDIYHHENKAFYRSPQWKSMRQYIYERDRGCCTKCGRFVFGREAHVHHEVPIRVNPLLKLDKNNLILLCPQCHMAEENKEEKKLIVPSYFNNL